jgi:hypothetical protein
MANALEHVTAADFDGAELKVALFADAKCNGVAFNLCNDHLALDLDATDSAAIVLVRLASVSYKVDHSFQQRKSEKKNVANLEGPGRCQPLDATLLGHLNT